MRINDIILEDQDLNELSLKGLGTGLAKLPGALAGGVVQGAKNVWQGAKQGYAAGQSALAPDNPQPTQQAQAPSNAQAASPNATAPQQKPGLVSTFKQAFQQGQQQGQDQNASAQAPATTTSPQRLNQIAQNIAATIGDDSDEDIADRLKYLQSQGQSDDNPIVKLYKNELAKRSSANTSSTSANDGVAPASSGQAAPASKPATINAAPVSPNIDAMKKAYTNLDPAEREKLKGELDIIDDQERLASGTNESLDDILKLAKLK